jgi:hypothetical protein
LNAWLVVIAMLSNTGWLTRSVVRDFQEEVQAGDRYVNVSVALQVVRHDPAGDELLPGKPRLRRVGDAIRLGGVIDTKLETPRILPGSFRSPRLWYCSEQQLPIVLHRESTPGQLVEGGMGAGKTTLGCMWTYVRWLEHMGEFREGGITAPTNDRLDVVLKELFGMFPAHWYHYQSSTHLITLCDGTRLRGVSTYQQSAAQGSRVQGYNWSWWLGDEVQDQLSALVDAQARLRSGRDGSKRLGTATSKDDPAYRTARENMISSGVWSLRRMLGPESPFVPASHWDMLKRQWTERDYRRQVLAEDLPSESRLYHTFDRKENVRPVPLGARKITSIVLKRKTGNDRDALLVGHDPGTAKAGSVWLDAYEVPGRKGEILWWVRGELFTLHATTEQHATQAMEITRKRFGCNYRPDSERAHVRSQPLGAAEDKPDLSVFAIWKRIGFEIKAAQYSKQGQGIGQIKKESRIGVVNTLFCNAEGKRRLFVECDDRGVCVAPLLVGAIEQMERDERGRAEHEEKNVRHDKSDLPAALGYALWPFEKELALALRADIGGSL